MHQPNIKICTFIGPVMRAYLPGIARLRIEVFRDYPYLYETNAQYETEYLRKYSNCKEAVVVIVFDGSEIIGASSGLPLEAETDELKRSFMERDIDLSTYYYFAESILLKKYRGRGIGHHFFQERERHVQKLQKYQHICFSCVVRPEDDPRKPTDYIPLDDFWKKRGYVKQLDMVSEMLWPDIGEEKSSSKQIAFWIKDLDQSKHHVSRVSSYTTHQK